MYGELRSLAVAERIELAEWYRLRLRLAEQIDPARQHIFDAGLGEFLLGLGDFLWAGEGILDGVWQDLSGAYSFTPVPPFVGHRHLFYPLNPWRRPPERGVCRDN